MVVDRVPIGEHALRQALTDDDHGFAAPAIGIVEIASGDDRDAEGGEESGRYGPKAATRILLARRKDVPIRRERERETVGSCIASRNRTAHGNAVHARQFLDPPDRLPVKARDLVGCFSV